MRLALVSSPRSGNTWLRLLLSSLYGLSQYAAHYPQAINWENLPENCIVQLHWHNEPQFASLLKLYGFDVVTIARHPLDLLLSVLHFAPHEPQTACWLQGEGGDESLIHNQRPTSEVFSSYATGARAASILSISYEWWLLEQTIKVRYEDLVYNPIKTLEKTAPLLGKPIKDYKEVVDLHQIDKLRLTSNNQHFWQGQPGLWKSLLTPDIALGIYRAHKTCFDELGYDCDPLQTTTRSSAIDCWDKVSYRLC